jgi:hypothetical protein
MQEVSVGWLAVATWSVSPPYPLFLVSDRVKQQIEDNCLWIQEAGKHQLVSACNKTHRSLSLSTILS